MSGVDEGQRAVGDEGAVAWIPEQQAGTEAVFPDLKLGEAWGDSITNDRATTLEQRLQAWEQEAEHGKRRGPFDGIKLTGADVFWLAARTLAGTSEAQGVEEQMGLLRRVQVDAPLRSRLGLSALHLSRADMGGVNLSGAFLGAADISGAYLAEADLSGAALYEANFSGADLRWANLSAAKLYEADLSGAALYEATLSGADLRGANLFEAGLSGARLSVETTLAGANLSNTTSLADVVWNNAPLARMAWERLQVLSDETEARQRRYKGGAKKGAASRRREYEAAVRAYRLLAVALRDQGLNEHADRFAYRAQVCQRRVLRLQRHYLRALGSWLLDRIAGYGYRPLRSLVTYILVIAVFAAAYFFLGNNVHPPLSIHDAIVFSITSFHGRGFSPGESITLHNPLTTLAAVEAIIGLLIEITFIATFTQRFFAR